MRMPYTAVHLRRINGLLRDHVTSAYDLPRSVVPIVTVCVSEYECEKQSRATSHLTRP